VLLTNVRKEARSPHSHFRAVEGTVAHSFFESDSDVYKEADARVVEGATLRAINVGAASPSAFTAFLDGIQRADVKLYHDTVPIVYAYGAAVIRERVERVMRTHSVSEREALFFPSQHLS
jgi:phage FluMu gp28-like protein